MTLEIACGGLRAALLGGPYLSVASLRVGERELLAAADEVPEGYRVHGVRAGITLLHPWANRLGADTFDVCGRRLCVADGEAGVGRDSSGLPIHGLAHPAGWELERVARDGARAHAAWPARAAFPFAHRVEVAFELSGTDDTGELTITTTLVSEEAAAECPAPVPVAFGWHPYFRCERSAQTAIAFPACHHLMLDEWGLPTGEAVPRPPQTLPLGEAPLDDLFTAVDPGAVFVLEDAGETIEVRLGVGYRHAQVFAPRDADVVALEPMTAPVDALRSGTGVSSVGPGGSTTARFCVRARAR